MTKTQSFEGYNLDIERLATRIQTYLAENHFEVAFSKNQTESIPIFFIQGRKRNALRTAAGIRRSTNISIKGVPDIFEIAMSTGEWGNNIIVSAPLFVIPAIGIPALVARIYTAKRFETSLWKYIREQADFLRNSAIGTKITKSSDQLEYRCDYVEGYPGWSTQVIGGKMILERQKTGTDRVIFEAPDGEQITIPATKIQRASIISRKTNLDQNDLMIEIICKDKNGNVITPILNLPDDVITGVLAGINELVADENYLKELYK
jgi:hypothetical protein